MEGRSNSGGRREEGDLCCRELGGWNRKQIVYLMN